MDKQRLLEKYGSKVFKEAVIRQRLTKKTYDSFLKAVDHRTTLDVSIAGDIAKAMMEWAIEKGATHYTHWFQPMTDHTAGKHDAFFEPTSIGEAMLEFPSSTLVKGEPDASSFPSGGIRSTFEARGYTTWDPTSPAFVRDGTLYIPSVFVSYSGESLDRKLPLLKSLEAVNRECLRFIKFFNIKDATRISASIGAEQEYFLVDREVYKKRLDLRMCGRTLIGADPPKGQQLDDHYFAKIRTRVADFMQELDTKLWELGIPAKTKHNEAAPSQHELAPVYEEANLASDHNQMTMEMMKSVAKSRGMTCLLHEKPFTGINGSGKHDNFSLVTDTDYNLFQPHEYNEDGGLFFIVLCAFIRAVDIHNDLIRMCAASLSNDNRLGGYEAPPPIVSIFLGEALTESLYQAAKSEVGEKKVKGMLSLLPSIPDFKVDDSDRNRTSPIAFTGNKFEYRMLGSSQSLAVVNTILCTTLADSFSAFADRLEKAENVENEKVAIIRDTLSEHGRVIFNGNNYSKEWIQEAKKRGLPIIKDAVEAMDALITKSSIDLFQRMEVYTADECHARYEVHMEQYITSVIIEASTLLKMIRQQITPAVISYTGKIANSYNSLATAGIKNEKLFEIIKKLSDNITSLTDCCNKLEENLAAASNKQNIKEKAEFMRDVILKNMEEIKGYSDSCELVMDKDSWPIPNYTDLLFSI